MKEIWKDVIGYEGYYQVSNIGNVYSNRRTIVLKHREGRDGYLNVSLSVDGKKKLKKIHRLVYESFIGELDRSLVIDHIDNNPHNNHVSNLRQITTRKNTTRGKVNKTGLTGVRFFKQIEKYGSEIQIEGKSYFLGVHESKKGAKKAYDIALSGWINKREKPFEVKQGFKLCRVCNEEKRTEEFRETKTKKGTSSTYYACKSCEKELKRERYYRNKNKQKG